MFDFIPVAIDRMVLASVSKPHEYLGGDIWMHVRPFRRESWALIVITTLAFILFVNVLTMKLKCFGASLNAPLKVKRLIYIIISFFFVVILAFYEGSLIMFFSTDVGETFHGIRDIMRLIPRRKLMMRAGFEAFYKHYAEAGDADYVKFWDQVENNPDETVFTTVDQVFKQFQENNVVIHELESAIDGYLNGCEETKENIDVYVREKAEYYNFIVPKNSPLGPILNHGTKLLFERGVLSNFKKSWHEANLDCSAFSREEAADHWQWHMAYNRI